MTIPELQQQLLQLPPKDKLYIIQLLAQNLTTHNIESLQLGSQTATLPTRITEYPLPQFYGCIQDETFFRHPQGNQSEHEPIL